MNFNDLSLYSASVFCLCLWFAPWGSCFNQRKQVWLKNDCICSALAGKPRMLYYGNVSFLLLIPTAAEYEGTPIENQIRFKV